MSATYGKSDSLATAECSLCGRDQEPGGLAAGTPGNDPIPFVLKSQGLKSVCPLLICSHIKRRLTEREMGKEDCPCSYHFKRCTGGITCFYIFGFEVVDPWLPALLNRDTDIYLSTWLNQNLRGPILDGVNTIYMDHLLHIMGNEHM